jgi:hypothetical protein
MTQSDQSFEIAAELLTLVDLPGPELQPKLNVLP